MTVILMILKAIGIAVLVILGLFLAAALAVLFVPVRYRADGSWREELTMSAQITWLLRLLNIRIAYGKDLTVHVSACGFRLYPKTKGNRKASGRQETDGAAEPESAAGQETGRKPPAIPESWAEQQAMPETAPEIAPETGTDGIKNRLAETFRKLRDSLTNIRSLAKRLHGQFAHYKAIWDREETQQAFRLASAQLCRTLRHVLPRRMDVRAAVGTGDPASTGQILAIHGMLYPWLGDRVQIVPDFEEKRFEGEFHLKGQIRAGAVGFYALRLMLDRNVRRLIGILRGRTADKEDHNG